MAVDLGDLIPNLKVVVSPPGTDLFGATTNNEWLLRLENAFWNARLDGLFTSFKAEDGEIVPIDPNQTPQDLGRDAQQLVILYAALDIVLAELRNGQSMFSAKAGSVEYETQKSAQLMVQVLGTLRDRIKQVVWNLNTIYFSSATVMDSVISRTESLIDGEIWWVR